MVKLLFSASGITAMRGTAGGTTFSWNTYGPHSKNKAIPTQPGGSAVLAVRATFGDIASRWSDLSAAQRLTWNLNAPNLPNLNVFGVDYPLTGFNLFCRLNLNLASVGEPYIDDWPGIPAVDAFDPLTVTANTTAGTLVIDFTPPCPADQKFTIWGTPGLSPGVSFVESEYRIIDIGDDTFLTGVDLAAPLIVKYGALWNIGEKGFIKFRPIHVPTGFPGVPSFGFDIAV